MVTKELLDYIKLEMSGGKSFEIVKNTLLQNGWNNFDTEEARRLLGISLTDSTILKEVPPPPSPATLNQPSVPNLQTTQVFSAPTTTTLTPNKKKKGYKILIISLIIITLILAAGTAYAYYSGYFISLEKISSEAYKSIQSSTSSSFDTTISVELPTLNKTANSPLDFLSSEMLGKNLSLSAVGSYDIANPESYKLDTKLSLNAGTFSGEIEFRLKDHIVYAILSKAPNISFIPILSEYTNKWFSFPLNSTTASDATSSFDPVSSLPFMSMIGLDKNTFNKLSQEQKDYMLDLTKNASFIKITKKLGVEKINEVPSYHFIFDLDRVGIKNYLINIENYLHSSGKNDSLLSSFKTKEVQDGLDKITYFTGEAWIGRNDHRPYKISISFDVSKVISESDVIKINIISIFKDWDKPIEVVAPTEVNTFESMVGGMMEESKLKSEDSIIKNYMTQALIEIKIFYTKNKNNYKGLCTSAESKLIQGRVSDKKGFACKVTTSAYAISAILSDKSYWCIDSSGYNNSTTKPITTTSCQK